MHNRSDARTVSAPQGGVTRVKAFAGSAAVVRVSEGTQTAYRGLLSGLYDAVLITTTDGRIIDANQRALDSFKRDRDDMLTLRVTDLFCNFAPALLDRVNEHLADGRFTVLNVRARCTDGETFYTETAIGRSCIAAEPTLVLSVRNIERRRQTEQQQRTERNALQNSASCIAIADLSATVQFVNSAFLKLWGYASEDDVKGMDIRDFWVDSLLAGPLVDHPLNGNTWFGEMAARSASGETFYVQGSAAPNRDAQEALQGMVYSFVDVTARKHAEETIRKAAQAQLREVRSKRDFAGQLNIVSLSDILQLIHSARKSGHLVVESEDHRALGEMFFVDGEVVSAGCGNVSGEEAVYALQAAKGSGFSFSSDALASSHDHSIRRSTMGLILEGARRIDESN